MAAASGVVVFSGWTYEFGNQIILYHGDDYFTHYGHNKQNFLNQLELVKRGDVIGLVGSTGISSGPHLHFEVWKKFEPKDPLLYFPEYLTNDLTLSNE
jgi:murein DD-endopeptidase MepM/ murein hydrolase activator NlpD